VLTEADIVPSWAQKSQRQENALAARALPCSRRKTRTLCATCAPATKHERERGAQPLIRQLACCINEIFAIVFVVLMESKTSLSCLMSGS
jgi:hypothetical protein